MTGFSLPYVITVSDGHVVRSIYPSRLGEHRATVDAVLSAILSDPAPQASQPAAAKPRSAPTTATMTQGEMARAQGYAGEPCTRCGGWRMKQAGHCMVCDDCGETTGCS